MDALTKLEMLNHAIENPLLDHLSPANGDAITGLLTEERDTVVRELLAAGPIADVHRDRALRIYEALDNGGALADGLDAALYEAVTGNPRPDHV